MSEKGQIVVPKEARDKRGFGHGSAFAFVETNDGDLIFRPVKLKPQLTLIEHLRKFKAVEIPDRAHRSPPRV
jgi:AbrB family looped-hinge helix DNA binding protein